MNATEIKKACGCGARYTEASWQALPLQGIQPLEGESSLEMRNCPWGSTLAGEVEAISESAPDWIVDRVEATGEGYYRIRVIGRIRGVEPFRWCVRDVADPRYDLTGAIITHAARPFLGRDVLSGKVSP